MNAILLPTIDNDAWGAKWYIWSLFIPNGYKPKWFLSSVSSRARLFQMKMVETVKRQMKQKKRPKSWKPMLDVSKSFLAIAKLLNYKTTVEYRQRRIERGQSRTDRTNLQPQSRLTMMEQTRIVNDSRKEVGRKPLKSFHRQQRQETTTTLGSWTESRLQQVLPTEILFKYPWRSLSQHLTHQALVPERRDRLI